MENNPLHKMSRDNGAEGTPRPISVPLPSSDAYDNLRQCPKRSVLLFRRTIRRQELRQIVP